MEASKIKLNAFEEQPTRDSKKRIRKSSMQMQIQPELNGKVSEDSVIDKILQDVGLDFCCPTKSAAESELSILKKKSKTEDQKERKRKRETGENKYGRKYKKIRKSDRLPWTSTSLSNDKKLTDNRMSCPDMSESGMYSASTSTVDSEFSSTCIERRSKLRFQKEKARKSKRYKKKQERQDRVKKKAKRGKDCQKNKGKTGNKNRITSNLVDNYVLSKFQNGLDVLGNEVKSPFINLRPPRSSVSVLSNDVDKYFSDPATSENKTTVCIADTNNSQSNRYCSSVPPFVEELGNFPTNTRSNTESIKRKTCKNRAGRAPTTNEETTIFINNAGPMRAEDYSAQSDSTTSAVSLLENHREDPGLPCTSSTVKNCSMPSEPPHTKSEDELPAKKCGGVVTPGPENILKMPFLGNGEIYGLIENSKHKNTKVEELGEQKNYSTKKSMDMEHGSIFRKHKDVKRKKMRLKVKLNHKSKKNTMGTSLVSSLHRKQSEIKPPNPAEVESGSSIDTEEIDDDFIPSLWGCKEEDDESEFSNSYIVKETNSRDEVTMNSKSNASMMPFSPKMQSNAAELEVANDVREKEPSESQHRLQNTDGAFSVSAQSNRIQTPFGSHFNIDHSPNAGKIRPATRSSVPSNKPQAQPVIILDDICPLLSPAQKCQLNYRKPSETRPVEMYELIQIEPDSSCSHESADDSVDSEVSQSSELLPPSMLEDECFFSLFDEEDSCNDIKQEDQISGLQNSTDYQKMEQLPLRLSDQGPSVTPSIFANGGFSPEISATSRDGEVSLTVPKSPTVLSQPEDVAKENTQVVHKTPIKECSVVFTKLTPKPNQSTICLEKVTSAETFADNETSGRRLRPRSNVNMMQAPSRKRSFLSKNSFVEPQSQIEKMALKKSHSSTGKRSSWSPRNVVVKKYAEYIEIVIAVESLRAKNHEKNPLRREYNFLDVKALRDMIRGFNICKEEKKCKAVLLSSVGPIFSSGLSPKSLLNQSSVVDSHDIISLMKQLVDLLIGFAKPIVAAVQGPAVGFGATLLLFCDFVYASDRADFHWPYTKLGLTPFGCVSTLLPQIMSRTRACALLLGGKVLTATEGKDFGLVTEVFPHDTFMCNVVAHCKELCSSFTSVVWKTKLLMSLNDRSHLLEVNEKECTHLKRCLQTETNQRVLKNYIDTRLIRYDGATIFNM